MAKKYNKKIEKVANTKWQVRKGRIHSKFRASWRLARAKSFMYIDHTAIVGAFSNFDLVQYMEKFSELMCLTSDEMDKSFKPSNDKDKKESKFSEDLDKIISKRN